MLPRWIVRVVSLLLLGGYLVWSWGYFLDRPAPDESAWMVSLIIATVAFGAIESSVVGFGAASSSLRRRLMLDGLSPRGTWLTGVLFLLVLVGSGFLALAWAGAPVDVEPFDLSPAALPWLQLAFGLLGAVLGVIFALVAILPLALTLALLMERTRDITEPKTKFGRMNMGELFGASMLLASIGAALLGILLANVSPQDAVAGWYVLTGLALVPALIGFGINKLAKSIRDSSASGRKDERWY
jgi:MFS family permease